MTSGANAGPWARDQGGAFLSFDLTLEEARGAVMNGDADPEAVYGLYGEWGLGDRLTAGVDLSFGETSRLGSVFLRRTLTDADSPVQAALHAGIAGRDIDGRDAETFLRLGGSIGRGFGAETLGPGFVALSHDGGWAVLDAAVFLDRDGEVRIWQVESALGLRLSDRWTALWAMKAEDWSGGSETVITARPSVLFALGDGMTARAGLVAGLSNSDTLGLSLSLWRDF